MIVEVGLGGRPGSRAEFGAEPWMANDVMCIVRW